MEVHFVPYKSINKEKWDECISTSKNRLIYSFSFYLDAMAGTWDALVLNDYEAVMPLTHKKKFAIAYLYQPPFVQQLGIFFKSQISQKIFGLFESEILKRYNFAEIALNYQNVDMPWQGSAKTRTNFLLDLNRSYQTLYDNYLPSFTKSLRRIKKFQFQYVTTDDYAKVIDCYEKEYTKRLTALGKPAYQNLKNVSSFLRQKGNVLVREVYSNDNILLAGVVLLQDAGRFYNIISFITPEGKKLEANYFMYDNIIRELSGNNNLLDLEGSDIKGIADFYKKMNPVDQPYIFWKYNNLHPIIKLFKR